MPSSGGTFLAEDRTHISYISPTGRRLFTAGAAWGTIMSHEYAREDSGEGCGGCLLERASLADDVLWLPSGSVVTFAASLNPGLPPKDLIRVSLPDSHWRNKTRVFVLALGQHSLPGDWRCFHLAALVLKVCQFSEFYDIETRGILSLKQKPKCQGKSGFYFSYAAEVDNIFVCTMLFVHSSVIKEALVLPETWTQ